MVCETKDYLVFWIIGLVSLTTGGRVVYHGEHNVFEGDPFELHCITDRQARDGWTLNSTLLLHEDNDLGYLLTEELPDPYRKHLVLQVPSVQLYHEGEYRCSRDSRHYHLLTVLPSLIEGNDVEERTVSDSPRTSNEYILEVNQTIDFFCSSAKDETTPVTWYKNSRRISPESKFEIDGHHLIIAHAQEEDAGEYMCTVDTPFVTGYTDIGRIFRLNSPPRIVEFPKTLSMIQGRSLSLHCEAQGFPLPQITWYIGNLPASRLKELDVRLSFYSTDGGLSSSYLIVRDVTPEDRGLYTCRAENSFDEGVSKNYDERSVFVYVRENMIETNEDEPGLGKILVPGEPLVLQCNTSECPHCTVVWFKDGERVFDILGHLVIHAKNNSVVIGDATYEDAGTYVCAIDRKQLDVALNATILVQSKIKLEKFDQSSTVVEGSPLELYCIAKGSPKPSIRWFIGGEEVLAESRVLLQENRSKLLIEVAEYADRNHYTCEAFNQFESVNTTVFIRVKDKLAALWPFLGICVEVAILCTIIFVYERRKSLERTDDPDIDFSTENKLSEPGAKGQDVRQRK